jgi:hypothetical protein
MSKVKNPQQKKQLSLDHDHRNTFYASNKGSRKIVAEHQQRWRKSIRVDVARILSPLTGQVDEETAAQAEHEAKVSIAKANREGFRKSKNKPLREVIATKLERRKK